MIRASFKVAGEASLVEVLLERAADARDGAYVLAIGDERAEIEVLPDETGSGSGGGGGLIRTGSRVHRYAAIRRGDVVHVWLDGRTYALEAVERGARRAGGMAGPAAGGGAITAPMPGTVLKILAAPGQAIEAHQALVVMESMKMEMTLSAPGAGRVSSVQCGEGELVEMGRVLMTLEEGHVEPA